MRTIVELPDQQIEALKAMSEQQGLSRAELMRRAVAEYLAHHQKTSSENAFGLWKKHGEDGVEYQQRLRQEWDE
ncbi:MAG: ribbon-helix-helix domain-containing protein [Chromatiales bacterium]|nr:ribbon-helix-helix domain-containing protein [Chromatiales bacterium]